MRYLFWLIGPLCARDIPITGYGAMVLLAFLFPIEPSNELSADCWLLISLQHSMCSNPLVGCKIAKKPVCPIRYPPFIPPPCLPPSILCMTREILVVYYALEAFTHVRLSDMIRRDEFLHNNNGGWLHRTLLVEPSLPCSTVLYRTRTQSW